MIFTDELKRRRNMTPEAIAIESDEFLLNKHKKLAKKVEDVFNQYLKGLPSEVLHKEAWQTLGDFQFLMEEGGFCKPGEEVKRDDNSLLHAKRVTKRDLQSASNNIKKAIESIKVLTCDTGAWHEFQRRLWECCDVEEVKHTRSDLFVLQTLSSLELIHKTLDDMLKEGILFKRDKWITQKARRSVIERLAVLFVWSRKRNKKSSTLSALQNLLKTITKAADYGDGRKTNEGNMFVAFVKEAFTALGLTGTSIDDSLSGTTIRKDILESIKEFKKIPKQKRTGRRTA